MSASTQTSAFEDLGFSPEEAERLALQVFLAEQIRTFIRRHRLSQSRAASYFGVQQPKISRIMNDNLDGMSIDYLVRMVARIGGKLSYSFRQPKKVRSSELETRLRSPLR